MANAAETDTVGADTGGLVTAGSGGLGQPGSPAPAGAPRRPVITRRRPDYSDGGDPQLAAYNRYLAWLNANPDARPADYPG